MVIHDCIVVNTNESNKKSDNKRKFFILNNLNIVQIYKKYAFTHTFEQILLVSFEIMNKSKDFLVQLGNNLRTHRNLKKMSMQYLADSCNIDKSTIYRIEKGLLNPTILMLKNISQILEIEICELVQIKHD